MLMIIIWVTWMNSIAGVEGYLTYGDMICWEERMDDTRTGAREEAFNE